MSHDEQTAANRQESVRDTLDAWMENVVESWRGTWKGRDDHRYGRDFGAFVGERLLTDFALRHWEREEHADDA